MQEKSLQEVLTNIESELYSAQAQLSKAGDITKSVLRQLDLAIQTTPNLFTQKDTHVCKCNETLSGGVIYTYGEKPKKDYQLTQDRVKIAEDFWKSFKSEE